MRVRVRAGEQDSVVLAAELAMAGAPVAETAALAARAVGADDTSATTAVGWSWHNAVRTLMLASATTSRCRRSTLSSSGPANAGR